MPQYFHRIHFPTDKKCLDGVRDGIRLTNPTLQKRGSPDRESGWLRPKGSASGHGDVSPSSEVADVCKKVHTWSREGGEHALPSFFPPPFLVLAVQKGDAANAIAAPNLTHPFPFLCPFESAGSLELISQPGPVQIREKETYRRRAAIGQRSEWMTDRCLAEKSYTWDVG